MISSAASKVMWVGRATVFMVGLAVILALVFGAASTAFGANGQAWILGQNNTASALTRLAGEGAQGAMLQVVNNHPDANDTALSLAVQAGEAPMTVNSGVKVANLNADRVDSYDSTALLPGGDLPPGRTVRGNFDLGGYVWPSRAEIVSDGISFGYRLASTPTVRVVKSGQTPPAECPGTASFPEAAKGYLCIYEKANSNLHSSEHPFTQNPTRVGTTLQASSKQNFDDSTIFFYTRGTWAVTGNDPPRTITPL